MAEIYISYKPPKEPEGKALFLVSITGKVFRVAGGVRKEPGVIRTPEEISYAVTLDLSDSCLRDRVIKVYSADLSSLIEETTRPIPKFERWIERGLMPIPDEWVYFDE